GELVRALAESLPGRVDLGPVDVGAVNVVLAGAAHGQPAFLVTAVKGGHPKLAASSWRGIRRSTVSPGRGGAPGSGRGGGVGGAQAPWGFPGHARATPKRIMKTGTAMVGFTCTPLSRAIPIDASARTIATRAERRSAERRAVHSPFRSRATR